MFREFFLGFIKIHILHHAAQEAVYGLALIEELRRHGYTLSPGTLYPVLHDLEEAGYLAREERVVGGKVRKYYTTTDQGRWRSERHAARSWSSWARCWMSLRVAEAAALR